MPEPLNIVAIDAIADIGKVRVVLYQGGQMVHAPFPSGSAGGGIEEAPIPGLYARSDAGWVAIPKITVSSTAPSSPAVDDVWIDTT